MNSSRKSSASRSASWLLTVVLASVSILFVGGCAGPVSVTSNPSGATAIVGGKMVGTTPTQVTMENNQPTSVQMNLDGYFPESFTYVPDSKTPIFATLSPRTLRKSYSLNSAPGGAAVSLNGTSVGTTPIDNLKVVYSRSSKNAPWQDQTLVFSKPNYESEAVTLSADTDSVPAVQLSLLRETRTYSVTAINTDKDTLSADVVVDGAKVGATPCQVQITFSRPNKNAAWPTFTMTAEIRAKYKLRSQVLTFDRSSRHVAFTLDPITEITTMRVCPEVVMTPIGAELKAVSQPTIAVLNTKESMEIASNLKMVTPYTRMDLPDATASRVESVNSFCVSPNGQNIIFARTDRDEHGNLFSNLFIKSADDASSGVSQLTNGSRYWDTTPYIANDGSNYLVFTSNRGDQGKTDIFRVSLVENRLASGISRLTSDNRFNYAPTYGDANRQLFYLSIEPDFPNAEPQVSSIRLDGALPTQLPINAIELNNTYPDKVYYVKLDPESNRKQLYSMTTDGKLETSIINQDDFRRSNCFNPAVSPDGSRLLFVSDEGTDERGRHNNDIFIVKTDGTGLQRLTQNGSDDIMPAWSPSEEGVIFFLSNRGGAYNVWRMKLISGTK